jgi:hypothetical protein
MAGYARQQLIAHVCVPLSGHAACSQEPTSSTQTSTDGNKRAVHFTMVHQPVGQGLFIRLNYLQMVKAFTSSIPPAHQSDYQVRQIEIELGPKVLAPLADLRHSGAACDMRSSTAKWAATITAEL